MNYGERHRPTAPRDNAAAAAPPASNFRPVTLCGAAAVLTCFAKRPAALKRLLHSREFDETLAPVRQWMREQNLPATLGNDADLTQAAGHRFHEGVVAQTERPHPGAPAPSQYEEWSRAGEPLLFIENVANPIQLGSIARVAAATGLKRLLLSGPETLAAYFLGRAWNAAAGALDLLTVHDAAIPLPLLLRDLRPRFCITGFTRPGGRRVDDLKPIRAPGRPLAIVIGGAVTGVLPATGGKCEHLLHIPGAHGNTLFTPADTAAYGLPWLLLRRPAAGGVAADGTPNPNGFLARKRAAKASALPPPVQPSDSAEA